MKRADIEALQLERLKWTVDYCINNVKFYHDRLTPLGITGDKIKCLKDIQYIPYTTKTDLRDNYPFGLFAVPQKDIVRIHASSGTTGKPTVVGYTKNDLANWAEEPPPTTLFRYASDTVCLRELWAFITALKR